MKREDGAAETAAAGVACTLTIGGRTIEFTLEGPLVAMVPAAAPTEKRPDRTRRATGQGGAAVGESGWRLTPRGKGYLAGYAEAQQKGAA